ncbi:MAG TPA: GDSL-type esterase/lipase family protein [Phenylobacterium sp.]|uniref:GDSL-type esterase/lipase family protein n=1 Tax=Phenylobacterium sp. TaxID=1871053 RepID=UPI002D70F8D7|nr:GDSL-type esterase/lipase family protein [Phenylobacterium sp.]HZZ67672.1 GDSL-type esterase/lipase family protein [Phenylobacterium sp.]
MRLSALVCALALAAPHAQAAGAKWIGSWGASPAMPMAQAANGRLPGTPTFDDQTVVQVVRLSAGGQRLRLRLSNEYGPHPLAIGAVRIALVGEDGAPIAGSDRPVEFGGEPSATLPSGAPVISDPVALPTKALARLRISLFLPADTHGCTCHMSGSEIAQVFPGDATRQPVGKLIGPATYRAFLTEVDVEAAAPAPVIVAFGDSITDGYHTTDGANSRWPDRLAERLTAQAAGRPIGVVNAGIGGNRVLTEQLPIFGQNALSRFDRDVLSVPGVTHVTVLEGVNDLGMTKPTPTAAQLIAGYRQLIARAHEHGLKIIGATVLPYGGAAYFTPAGEAERQKINAWIRTGHEFDGVIDFDAAIRDPAHPEKMRLDLQSGDWLHPNDAGYRVMGDAVDLRLFR